MSRFNAAVYIIWGIGLGFLGISHIVKDDGLGGLFLAVSFLLVEYVLRSPKEKK